MDTARTEITVPAAAAPPRPNPALPLEPPAPKHLASAPPPVRFNQSFQSAATRPDMEEIHIREVFAEYIATRRACGESTANLGIDKFRKKLEENRNALVARYQCRTARFSVYIKEGKAAIKATPVRN